MQRFRPGSLALPATPEPHGSQIAALTLKQVPLLSFGDIFSGDILDPFSAN